MEITSRRGEQRDARDASRVLRWRVEAPAEPSGPRPFVLVAHGFKGFMDWGFFPELSRRLAATGRVCVSFNFSGSGIGAQPEELTEHEAFARNTYTRELEDLARMTRFARELPEVDMERGALLGHSRGGGMALVHAAEDGLYRSVVTWAPISRVDRFDEETVERWRQQGYLPIPNARTGQVHRLKLDALHDVERSRARLDIRAACARISAPTLVLHGTRDEAVPFDEGVAIVEALPPGIGELVRVEGAGHTFGARHPFDGVGVDLERAITATTLHLDRHVSINA